MTVFPTAQVDAFPPDTTDPGNGTTVNDTPEGNLNGASLLNGEEEENLMPPNLETFIPAECLPDIVDVYMDNHFIHNDLYIPYSESEKLSDLKTRTVRKPIKFVRRYPVRTPTDQGVNGSKPSVDVPDRDCPKAKVVTGLLDLRRCTFLGEGHHSKVFLAPLTIPSTQPVPRAVAVKFSFPHREDRDMLRNEAKIYDAFPRNLQDGDAPIVPKFYGYYKPSTEASDLDDCNHGDADGLDKEKWKAVRKALLGSHTSILLVEACGNPLGPCSLPGAARRDIAKLLNRLHKANFIQGSFYRRNILVQPGPLTLPRADRSLEKPSYRIIDFGRGQSPHVDFPFSECMRVKAEEERCDARWRGLIP